MRIVYLAVAVSCSHLLACGGAIQQEDDSQGAKKTFSTPVPAAGTPYGAWDLVFLEGMPGGKPSTQTFGHLFLELRNDGTAVARRCTKPYFDIGQSAYRCADSSAYDCLYGSVTAAGGTWRVDIPALGNTSKDARGEIIADESDTIVVRYVLPKYSAGTFIRVTEDPPTRTCIGP